MNFKKLSILIPVYNEKHTIEILLEEVMKVELLAGMEKEIIVVDDGSTDGTKEILKNLEEKKINSLRIFYNEKNMGKGATISRALSNSTGDICLIQDADLEYNPKEYKNLLEPIILGDADVVYGSRFIPSNYARVLYFWHYLGNRFLTFLSNFFTNLNLSDMETCYKVAIGPLFRSIPIRSKRFGIEPEITSKFAKRKFRIYEVPISYKGRTYLEGKKITWWDGIKTLGAIFLYWILNDSLNENCINSKKDFLEENPKFQIWLLKKLFKYIGEEVLEIETSIGNRMFFLLPRERYMGLTFNENYFHQIVLRFGQRKGVGVYFVKNKEEFLDKMKEIESFDTIISLKDLNFEIEDFLNVFADKLKQGGFLIFKGKIEDKDKILKNGLKIERVINFNPLGNLFLKVHNKLLKEKKPCFFFKMLYEKFLFILKIGQAIPLLGERIFILKK